MSNILVFLDCLSLIRLLSGSDTHSYSSSIPLLPLSVPLWGQWFHWTNSHKRVPWNPISRPIICVDTGGRGQSQPSHITIQLQPCHVFSSPSRPLICRMSVFEMAQYNSKLKHLIDIRQEGELRSISDDTWTMVLFWQEGNMRPHKKRTQSK